jgi:diguanylate cyclase (GGDEF)-like protein
VTVQHGQDSTSLSKLFGTVRVEAAQSDLASAAEASLVFIYPKGAEIGRRYVLGPVPTLIGRTADCQIINPHTSVSRVHAKIELLRDGRYQVTDLGSTNGTYVNNARVRSAPLADGDYLRAGNCMYRFLTGGNVEAEYHEEIYRLTVLDPLTGAYNRRYFDEAMAREVGRAERHGRPLSLALFDIDHFKAINDKMGHVAGDLTLRDFAGCVRPLVRCDEVFARYGGEEFSVILPEAPPARAAAFAERVRLAVAEHPFTFEVQAYRVTVSAGVGGTDGTGPVSAESLIERADEMLYRSKRTGRNKVSF